MNHADHVHLLRQGITTRGGIWADFGSGTGAFTLALADLIGSTGTIYSIDQNADALKEQTLAMKSRFPDIQLHTLQADFTQLLALPLLDGIVMANALHFVHEKDEVIEKLHGYLKPEGRLLMVEYNVDHGNRWVPYPLSFPTWKSLATKQGFEHTSLLATYPSRFLGEIFSAVSVKSLPNR
jgi:ubiquinone/menaquinone biosynthesis C-methylase UbiE